MLVESLMTRDVESARPESTLADAAGVMWRRDCGVVPVVDEDGGVVGVITDRDICMALSTRGRPAAEVRVSEVMARGVQTCTPVDDVREALEAMGRRQVRRLPVVDSRGHLVGLLSINDIIRHTRKGKGKKRVPRRATLAALQSICAPHGSGENEAADATAEEASGEEHYESVFTQGIEEASGRAGDDAHAGVE
jgi:CBS domain-containing protein